MRRSSGCLMRLQTLRGPTRPTLARRPPRGRPRRALPRRLLPTTNLDTRAGRRWLDVDNPGDGLRPHRRARCCRRTDPCTRCRCPTSGRACSSSSGGRRKVHPEPDATAGAFGFVEPEVSPEKPHAVLVRQVAGMACARPRGGQEGSPGWAARASSTGAAPALVARSTPALPTCSSPATRWPPTTSSRRSTAPARRRPGDGARRRARHHIRALNTIRREGPDQRRGRQRPLTSGIMHALVTHEKAFVLVGSGP